MAMVMVAVMVSPCQQEIPNPKPTRRPTRGKSTYSSSYMLLSKRTQPATKATRDLGFDTVSLTYAAFRLYVEMPKMTSDGAKAKAAVALQRALTEKSSPSRGPPPL